MQMFGSKRLRRIKRLTGKRKRVRFNLDPSPAATFSSDENSDEWDELIQDDDAPSSDFRQGLLTWIVVYLTVFGLHVSYDITPYSIFINQVKERNGSTKLASWSYNAYPITYSITGFLLAKKVPRYDAGNVLLLGTLVAGIAGGLYGFVGYLKSLSAYMTYHMILQIIESVGSATANLAASVILVNTFSEHVNKLEGFHAVVQTSARLIAHELGKRLYKVGGGVLANGLCGLLLLIICLIVYKFLPEAPGKERHKDMPGWLSMMKLPWLYILVLINSVNWTAAGVFDVKMTRWFVKHGFKKESVNVLFKWNQVVSMVVAVIFGSLADIKRAPIPLFLILGLILGGEAFFLVGPSPLFPIKLNDSAIYTVAVAGVILSGVFSMLATIPTFAVLLYKTRLTGIPSLSTISMTTAIASGTNKFCDAFGWKLNEKLSAKLGLRWHTTVMGFCLTATAVIVLLAYIVDFCLKRDWKEDSVEETKPIQPENH